MLDVTAKHPSVSIRILDSKIPDGSDYVHELFEINGSAGQLKSVVEQLKDHDNIHDVDIMESKKRRVFGSLKTQCPCGKVIASSKCFLTVEEGTPNGAVELTAFGSEKHLRSFLDDLNSMGIKNNVLGWSSKNDSCTLTGRQQQLLQAAFESGYFDFPKKIKLRKLAGNLSVSPSSLVESLKSAEKKILKDHFNSKQ